MRLGVTLFTDGNALQQRQRRKARPASIGDFSQRLKMFSYDNPGRQIRRLQRIPTGTCQALNVSAHGAIQQRPEAALDSPSNCYVIKVIEREIFSASRDRFEERDQWRTTAG